MFLDIKAHELREGDIFRTNLGTWETVQQFSQEGEFFLAVTDTDEYYLAPLDRITIKE